MKHEEELIAILKKNTTLWAILEKAPSFGLKNYYIGAGFRFQFKLRLVAALIVAIRILFDPRHLEKIPTRVLLNQVSEDIGVADF
jgi:glucan biosynthesis protein